MSTEAGPALSWPIRLACGALGMLLSWIAWGMFATWAVTAHSLPMRVLATMVVGAPFLALAALGAGQAVPVPEAGEEALEAEWVRSHPWQARLKWLITVAAGVYGAVRAGEALAAGQRVPVDSIAASVVGAVMLGALVSRWRRRGATSRPADASPPALHAPARSVDPNASRERNEAAPRRGAP